MKKKIAEDRETMNMDPEELKIMEHHSEIARKTCFVIAGQSFHFIWMLVSFYCHYLFFNHHLLLQVVQFYHGFL